MCEASSCDPSPWPVVSVGFLMRAPVERPFVDPPKGIPPLPFGCHRHGLSGTLQGSRGPSNDLRVEIGDCIQSASDRFHPSLVHASPRLRSSGSRLPGSSCSAES
jgi:hypothetical protein